jgi:hypothetical protein
MDNIRKIVRELILEIVDDTTKTSLYSKSNERKPFAVDVIKQAIEGGLEIGLLFKSDNEDYTMPTSKYRIIQPVALGYSKKNNMVIRGFHIIGQSEKKARETGVRSAEVENEWRMFNVKNIKGVWLTGRTFNKAPNNYNPSDKSMNGVIIAFDPNKAKILQNKKNAESQQPTVDNPANANIIPNKITGPNPTQAPGVPPVSPENPT